jgi:hypothetical protein
MPYERRISKKVRAIWGFDDGHVEIVVRIPVPIVPDPEVSLRIEPDEIPIVEEIAREAREWLTRLRLRPDR